MPSLVTRYMDVLEYPVLRGFTGQELINNVSIDPSKITGLAADSNGNYFVNAGTILCKTSGNKHTVLGGWVTGETGGAGTNFQNQGNNGTSPVAQVQTVKSGAVSKFFLVDGNGNQTTELEVKSTAAAVETALNKLPGASGGYKVALVEEGVWKITSQGNLLGLDKTLTVKEVSGAAVTVTQNTEGQYIDGILGINLRFFGTTSASTTPGPMFRFNAAFDQSRIQNFAFYKAALLASPALRNSQFS